MKTTTDRRLIRLEGQHHDGTLIEDDTGAQSRPDQCPNCGKLIPIRLVLHLHGVNWNEL